MMRTTARAALSATQTPCARSEGNGLGVQPSGRQERLTVPAEWTDTGSDTPDSAAPTPSAKPLTASQLRKREPEEQGAFLFRMVRAAAKRAKAEDPGRGLRMLLAVHRRLGDLINEVGEDLVSQVGSSAVGDDLGMSKTAVDNRWGPKAAAKRAAERDASPCTCAQRSRMQDREGLSPRQIDALGVARCTQHYVAE